MSSFSRWRPHPWHGLTPGPDAPRVVHAYIEITPFDAVKYEVDKETGYLRVDRPQRYSSQVPALYGFVPQTYCAERVRALSPEAERGDGDPLDICVLSERPIARAEVLLNARVIGGLRMVDGGEADDKIIAVLENDGLFGDARDIGDAPRALVERLRHYFLTYKLHPDAPARTVSFAGTYGAQDAQEVIRAAMDDYDEAFSKLRV
ncbi:MAG: inorganic pyrophosphatase [Planctomycetota bacterium]|nr:MAG: inorganic pyrophosphatase [Planctomycetota bacterium]